MPEINPLTTENETERLLALRRYHLLDTAPEAVFDSLTRLAAQCCAAPVALITLVDEERVWFKSCYGMKRADLPDFPRAISASSAAIQGGDVFVVLDTLADSRFAGAPLVVNPPYFRFYAGCPLITPKAMRLGRCAYWILHRAT